MAVLFYQLGIFIAIQIAAVFGRKSRNTAIILISIFTILQVFVSWLLLLQFITIAISYNISNNLFFTNATKFVQDRKPNKVILKSYDNKGGRIYQEYDENDENLSPDIRTKIENEKETRRLSQQAYDSDPEHRKAVDDVIANMFKNIPKK